MRRGALRRAAGMALGVGLLFALSCSDTSIGRGPIVGEPAPGEPPIPVPTPGLNVVQLVNQSSVTLLLGAFGPTAVVPREGKWELPPGGWLTVDIPAAWRNSTTQGSHGPRFWARTGCRYDAASDIAQCETGDCGSRYDCSAAALAGVAPTTIGEFCFNCGYDFNYWDVSVVDGANLSVDIEPLPPYSATNPKSPGDTFWCVSPNSVSGADLRANCPSNFQLKRSDLSFFIQGDTDGVVACFSNCGKYEYPTAPAMDCDDSDPRCASWKQFCCQANDYQQKCAADAECTFGGTCWEGKCACRGFTVKPDCPPDVCTNQEPSAQPPYGLCSEPTCIGDDTVHEVFPRAYTWPNDPQTYDCDTTALRITFAPGNTSVPITDSGAIPSCSSLPPAYGYATANQLCSGTQNKVFAGARLAPANWDCSVMAATNGVLCRW